MKPGTISTLEGIYTLDSSGLYQPYQEPEPKYWWSGIALYGWVIAFALAGVGVLVFAG
jgi:hypothetical protein